MSQKEVDTLLDHDADGIREFDNALPKWWLYGFYFTIVFGVGYMTYYHVAGGPSSADEYRQQLAEAKAMTSSVNTDALASPRMDAATLAMGKEIFEGNDNLCHTCHRADLGGQVGPNLTDEYWLHGGTFADLAKSITTGFPDRGMLPFGSGAKLTPDKLLAVASYVWSRYDSHPPDPKPIESDRDVKVERAHDAD
jgi:cytochrome c oxidase cbb3-type subunit 3